MATSHFLTNLLLHASSRSSFLLKPTTPFFYNSIKKFGEISKGRHGRFVEERAPSTAEEFQRVAEEKTREAQKRLAEEAAIGNNIADSKLGSLNTKNNKGKIN